MWKAFGPLYRKGWLFQKQNWNPTLCIQNWGHTQSGAAISKLPWKRVYRDVAFSYIYKHWFDSYARSCSDLPVLPPCGVQKQKGKWWRGVSKSRGCSSRTVLCLHSRSPSRPTPLGGVTVLLAFEKNGACTCVLTAMTEFPSILQTLIAFRDLFHVKSFRSRSTHFHSLSPLISQVPAIGFSVGRGPFQTHRRAGAGRGPKQPTCHFGNEKVSSYSLERCWKRSPQIVERRRIWMYSASGQVHSETRVHHSVHLAVFMGEVPIRLWPTSQTSRWCTYICKDEIGVEGVVG